MTASNPGSRSTTMAHTKGNSKDGKRSRQPVAPYMAIGLSTVVYGIGSRKDIQRNLDTIEDAIHAAMSVVSINLPVKIVALAEGALTGFTDEAFDLPHRIAARDLFIEIPGEETERLGRIAAHYETYLIAQCKARWPEVMKERYFNTLFVISPEGKVVHKAAKNHVWCREHSCTPHDVYDRWVEVFGESLEAVRALAFNGAEVVYRPSEAIPMTNSGYPGGGTWMIQNQAHAHFNSLYMICPNIGPVFLHPGMKHPFDIAGGHSHIVDYMGSVVSYSPSGYNTAVAATVDIEALRQFRVRNLNSNWIKDLRTEIFRKMYDKPIHPKNLWMKKD